VNKLNGPQVAFLSLLLVLVGCGGGSGASAGAPGAPGGTPGATAGCTLSAAAPSAELSGTRVLLQVRPSAASSCATSLDEPSQAYRDTGVPAKGLLALFLPGTGGAPAQFPAFLQRGAARGFHTIGLTYLNSTSVNVTCNNAAGGAAANGNADCAGAVREEGFTGRDTSPLVAVGREDSIEGRLAALLKYLDFHRPGEGWAQFLDARGGVLWAKVSVSGNSQGAGYAGYIGKVRQVYRVGLYAGPSDWVLATNSPVSWYSQLSLTPASAFYGFVHAPDTLANASGDLNQVTRVWGASDGFAMAGAPTNVATLAAPFGNSRRLVTTACASADATTQHNCPMFRGNEAVWDVVSFP
jgi:hypothetical protein